MASLEQLPIGRRYARESVASPLPFLQALYRKKAGNSHSRYPNVGSVKRDLLLGACGLLKQEGN